MGKKLWLVGVLFLLLSLGGGRQVLAGNEACTVPGYRQCYPARRIDQWACEVCTYNNTTWHCSNDFEKTCRKGNEEEDCGSAYATCDPYCEVDGTVKEGTFWGAAS